MTDVPGISSAVDAARVFFEFYQAHDVDGMLSLCSSTAQLRHVPMGRFETGDIHTVGRKAWSDMFAALPDLAVTVNLIVAAELNVAVEVVIADAIRAFELPQAYFLTVDDRFAITNVTVYWDNVTMGLEGTKAGAVRLVEAIASLGKR